MAYPFETIYLNQRLHVPMTNVGLILGITLLAALPMQVIGGAVADRYGRRPLLMVAICGSMVLYVGLGLTRQLWLIVALIAIEAAFGWAQYITASNAIVADLTPFEQRADAFSITRVALNAGTVLGPLLAVPLISLDASFHLTFVVAGVVCGGFLVMVIFLFKETRPAVARTRSTATAFLGYGQVLRDRRMLAFCLVALLPLYGFGQVWVTMPIMLEDLHGVSPQTWGIVVAVYAAATALLQYPVIKVLGRYDHMLLMALSSLSIGIGMGGAALAPWPLTFVFVVMQSFGIALLIPIAATVVSRLAPTALRGRYMGAWTLVYIGGYALGPLLGGWTLETLGGRGAFLVIAVAGLAGGALFPLLRERAGARPGHPPGEPGEQTSAPDRRLRGERPEQAL